MATYAIGDIQGCSTALNALLEAIRFDPAQDRLWLVGDLVNRGPDSAGVLRLVRDLGASAIPVLGNHDLHLLAVANGIRAPRKDDTFHDVLQAPDRDDLLEWLRQQRLLYRDSGFLVVHAGLLPQWTVSQALSLAHEVEQALRAPDYPRWLTSIYHSTASVWRDDEPSPTRLGLVTNILTRMRVCTPSGRVNLKFTGPPRETPPGFSPWYEIPPAIPRAETIIFGHWSALGIVLGEKHWGLDGGCVWGKSLAAVRIEDRHLITVSCRKHRR